MARLGKHRCGRRQSRGRCLGHKQSTMISGGGAGGGADAEYGGDEVGFARCANDSRIVGGVVAGN